MNNNPYTPEAMEQVGRIYDKLERLPADKRSIVELMTESFINGMKAQERLNAQALGVQESA
ncbi:MAG: hypothetical protein HDT35_08370 [Clostridiales bacterium]|nr:hypothetical protein [Clostridiales bacterium]